MRPSLLKMGVSIVELNVLDLNFIIFHNSSHNRLPGGGGGGVAAMISGKLYWIFSQLLLKD